MNLLPFLHYFPEQGFLLCAFFSTCTLTLRPNQRTMKCLDSRSNGEGKQYRVLSGTYWWISSFGIYILFCNDPAVLDPQGPEYWLFSFFHCFCSLLISLSVNISQLSYKWLDLFLHIFSFSAKLLFNLFSCIFKLCLLEITDVRQWIGALIFLVTCKLPSMMAAIEFATTQLLCFSSSFGWMFSRYANRMWKG